MTDLVAVGPPHDVVDVETVEDWAAVGRRLARFETGLTWTLGDWLLIGEQRFPDRYMAALQETGLNRQTLWNAASVSRRVPIERRRAELSWSHHRSVAHLRAEDQVRLLAVAVDNGLSNRALEAVVGQEKADLSGPSKDEPPTRAGRAVSLGAIVGGLDDDRERLVVEARDKFVDFLLRRLVELDCEVHWEEGAA